jgi:hypothetical protein
MSTTVQENVKQQKESVSNAATSGLKHGQFITTMKTKDNHKVQHTVDHLTQEELADGWRLVMPRVRKDSTIHHFSIYLSQLPPYLWAQLRENHSSDEEHYEPINDSIYQYSVKPSKHDSKITELYKQVMKTHPDRERVSGLYKYLEEQRVKGWIMIRAKQILSH